MAVSVWRHTLILPILFSQNPSVLGSQTLILLLIQYGCSTLAVESLELADFSSGLQSTGATNSLAVNRYPLDRTVSQNSDTDIGSVGYGIGEYLQLS